MGACMHVLRCSLIKFLMGQPISILLFNRSSDMSKTFENLCDKCSLNFGSISIPTLFLPVAIAASVVVPVPRNGSKTVSSLHENMFINR